MEEIVIYSHLEREEAEILMQNLRMKSIYCIKKMVGGGLRSTFPALYVVSIHKKDLEKARLIVSKFKETLKKITLEKKITCSKCGSKPPVVFKITNLNLFQKIISFGTVKLKCNKCESEWYV